MTKDAYWFKHDSTSGRGTRMMRMQKKFGHWGKGIYWDIIEILREQEGYKFDYDEENLELLSDLIRCDDLGRFTEWMTYCVQIGLFVLEEGVLYSPILSQNMGVWERSKVNGSKGGRPEKPIHKTHTQNPEVKPKGYDKTITHVQNHNIRRDKIRREREETSHPHSFHDDPSYDFNTFCSKFTDWPSDKLRYYHQALIEWSEQGNLYKDWIAAARTWARRDELKGVVWSDRKTNKQIGNGMMDSFN